MKTLFLLIPFLCLHNLTYTQQRYQDQITLKNDSVYAGIVIEQTPGKEIKLYRETHQDTLVFKMTDILKLNKVFEPRNQKGKAKKE